MEEHLVKKFLVFLQIYAILFFPLCIYIFGKKILSYGVVSMSKDESFRLLTKF